MTKNPSLKGKKVILTGKFAAYGRKDAEALLKKAGATVASSVGPRLDACIAGRAAGSKLYDALRFNVPILAEGHLQSLLDGAPLAEQVALARTFYTLESCDKQPRGSLSAHGGLPPGIDAKRWPRHGGAPMVHLATFDLATMPALQAHYPGQRTFSVFCAADREVSMYEIASPDNGMVVGLFADRAQIDAKPAPPAVEPTETRFFKPVAHTWAERPDFDSGARVLGGVPFWCQSEQHQGNFIMQCGEELGISGDGLVYVFDDKIFAQFT
jgi:hypothetical protein